MQTFLPYASFDRSAQVLDPTRRWKQCVEARQLVAALEQGPTVAYPVEGDRKNVYGAPTRVRPGWGVRVTPWYNHPACVMWRGHVAALKQYFNWMLHWVYTDKTHKVVAFGMYDIPQQDRRPPMPWWFGNRKFHAAHRSNLLRKDPEYYGSFGWTEPADLPYLWPTEIISEFRQI